MSVFSRVLAALACAHLACAVSVGAVPLSSSFTYQGALQDSGAPASGEYDMQFRLWDDDAGGSQVGSTITRFGVQVSDGRFTLEIDFGASAFTNEARWLSVSVRPAGVGLFAELMPRQPMTPTPFASSAAGLALPIISGTDTAGSTGYALHINGVGVSGIAGVTTSNGSFGVAAIRSTTANPSGAALLVLEDSALNDAVIGTAEYGGIFFGDVLVASDETYLKAYTPGTTNPAVPIAYGYVSAAGNAVSGTPNFTCVWDTVLERYNITIENESYFVSTYCTQVTANTKGVFVRTSSSAGDLIVYVEDQSGTRVQGNFQFTTFKPGASLAAAPQDAESLGYEDDNAMIEALGMPEIVRSAPRAVQDPRAQVPAMSEAAE